ncbi:MAG TPA: hypothetical protein VLS93_06940 [Anaeromyxobacteraceae bacterium]|nr:hypothetical protein [Anaeromyxobacteraceae bacterium]
MADPPRHAPPKRIQDVAKEYARDVLPTGAPARPPPAPPAPAPAAQRVRDAARDIAREMAPAAQRVKEMAKDLAPSAQRAAGAARDFARDLAQDLSEGYRRSNRYVRMRAAVIASFTVLTLASLWIACPSSGPTNDLDAEVKLAESFLGNQLLLRNESDGMWTDVTVTLEGGWRLDRRTIRPGDEMVVSVAQFEKDGQRAPKDFRPGRVTIECREGSATVSLAAR